MDFGNPPRAMLLLQFSHFYVHHQKFNQTRVGEVGVSGNRGTVCGVRSRPIQLESHN